MQQVLIAACIFLALGAEVNGGIGADLLSSANTEMQTLKVERSNPYCNFQRLFGPVCNMTGFHGILVIEPDAMLTNALEIAINGAETILLYPTCVPWVKLFGAQEFLTSQHKAPGAGEENNNCRTWLRAYDSKISSLRSSIHDISLVNSSVETINLRNLRDFKVSGSNISVIEQLDWKGYRGEISSSKIENIFHLECNDNLTTIDTWVGKIGFGGFSFNGKQLVVNHTIIDEVYLRGILLNSGVIKIENTILRKVSRESIILGSDATLLMKNVTIEECQKPCITTSFRLGSRYFKATDVTVNGSAIEDDLDVVRVTLDEIVDTPRSLEDDPNCESSAEGLLCDFSNFDQKVVLTPNDNSMTTQVNISNSADLHIVDACDMDVVVTHSKGVYTQRVQGSKLCEGTGGTLTSINSTFNVLHAKDLEQLTAVHSKLDAIYTDTVNKLVSRESDLMIWEITVSNETNIYKSNVDVMTATFNGTLRVNETQFSHVSELYIAGNAEIVNSNFEYLGIHSITVSGSLLLSHIVIQNYDFLPIYLTESGKIELHEVTLDLSGHFISALSFDQVNWEGKSQEELKHLVALRIPEEDGDGTAVADEGQRNCTSSQQILLTTRGKHDVFCNYTGVEDVQRVTVNLAPSIITKALAIQGAKHVRMSDICTHVITLMNVTNATMDYVPHHCFYGLAVLSSNVMNIVNEPSALRIDSSNVGEIETPFPMIRLGIHNSSIDSLLASPATTLIERSNISSIKLLMSHQSFVVKHSTIETIEAIQVHGSGALMNSNINRINFPGIQIDGHLSIENVTIKFLDKESITFVSDGSLTMKNVDIIEGSPNSFNPSRGSISITNVTMSGAPLNNNLKIDSPPTTPPTISKGTPSIAVKGTTAPAAAPTTKSPAKPEGHPTDDVKAVTSASRSPTSSIGDLQTQPWVKWATAGASIFLALVVVLVALSLVVVVRTYRSGETFSSRLSRMFLVAKDDEEQLSTELDIHLASDRDASTTHYSRLPSL